VIAHDPDWAVQKSGHAVAIAFKRNLTAKRYPRPAERLGREVLNRVANRYVSSIRFAGVRESQVNVNREPRLNPVAAKVFRADKRQARPFIHPKELTSLTRLP